MARLLGVTGQIYFAGTTIILPSHLDDEGLNCFDIWTFTSWCQQAGCLNVIRTNLIDANPLEKMAKQVASLFEARNEAFALAA